MFAKGVFNKLFTGGSINRVAGLVAFTSITTAAAYSVTLQITRRNMALCETVPSKQNTTINVMESTPAISVKSGSESHAVANSASDVHVVNPSALEEDDITIEADDEEDAKWIAEKSHCSFCKMFIFSPCKPQFKLWSQCVDSAKEKDEDFAQVCSEHTKALMNCTSANAEYFQALEQRGDGDDEEAEVEVGEEGEEKKTDPAATTSAPDNLSAADLAAVVTEMVTNEEK